MTCIIVPALMLQALATDAIIRDETHESRVFGETRHYRIFLPPDYTTSGKRYPVIHWFHGWGERYNKTPQNKPLDGNYDQGAEYRGDTIARFVGSHDVIVVKWDGDNSSAPGDRSIYNVTQVTTHRQIPLYFPELIAHIDSTYRTIADREHRATAGLSMGGFLSFWVAGKYPHLVSSASSFMGATEFVAGPRGFPAEYRHEEMHGNFEGLRTRLVIGSRDPLRYYHARLNTVWSGVRPFHESETYDSHHGTPHMGETLDFHLRTFVHPLPRPETWNHIDVYPEFEVWDWRVSSGREQPGFTVLSGVSRDGFRSSVREWVPSGRILADVKLRIVSAALYPPGRTQTITIIRNRDGEVRRKIERADSHGRLTFELDGEDYHVGVGDGSILALGDHFIEGAAWGGNQRGRGANVRVRFWNKGAAPSAADTWQWEAQAPAWVRATSSRCSRACRCRVRPTIAWSTTP